MILAFFLLQAAAAEPCARPPELPPAAAEGRCQALALARQGQWRAAAEAFDLAAQRTRGGAAADLWAQAGNAWLAANEPGLASIALRAALAWADGMASFDRGELMLDQARAAVGMDDLAAARRHIDQALLAVPEDPLAWLLSATLARRTKDLPRAKKDIGEALRRAADDASVQLEAGNIAAASGDEAGARAAWGQAARIAPDAPAGKQALAALAQFGAGEPVATPVVQPAGAPR